MLAIASDDLIEILKNALTTAKKDFRLSENTASQCDFQDPRVLKADAYKSHFSNGLLKNRPTLTLQNIAAKSDAFENNSQLRPHKFSDISEVLRGKPLSY